jgi:hypothetical protein
VVYEIDLQELLGEGKNFQRALKQARDEKINKAKELTAKVR